MFKICDARVVLDVLEIAVDKRARIIAVIVLECFRFPVLVGPCPPTLFLIVALKAVRKHESTAHTRVRKVSKLCLSTKGLQLPTAHAASNRIGVPRISPSNAIVRTFSLELHIDS